MQGFGFLLHLHCSFTFELIRRVATLLGGHWSPLGLCIHLCIGYLASFMRRFMLPCLFDMKRLHTKWFLFWDYFETCALLPNATFCICLIYCRFQVAFYNYECRSFLLVNMKFLEVFPLLSISLCTLWAKLFQLYSLIVKHWSFGQFYQANVRAVVSTLAV